MSWADTVFVVGLLEQLPAFESATYVTQTPKPSAAQPAIVGTYALVHPADGIDEQTRNTGPAQTEHFEATVHLVGSSANQVKVLADLFKPLVIVDGFGIIPTIEGRRCQRMYWRSPIPVQTDPDVTPPICFYVVEVGWVSDPA